MGKLFGNQEEVEVGSIVSNSPGVFSLDIENEIEDTNNTLEIVSEAFKTTSNELFLVNDIYTSINSKKLATVEYFAAIENYTPVMKVIANNLGVKMSIPSLEDFKNPYGIKASHEIAIEGFFDYVKKIWEKIKEIFKAFFKKIDIFFKRLVNANLDIDSYETYLKDLINKIKNHKLEISDKTVDIDTKLPSLLVLESVESVDVEHMLNTIEIKTKNFIKVTNEVFSKDLKVFIEKDLNEIGNKISKLINRTEEDYSKINVEVFLQEMSDIINHCLGSIRRIYPNTSTVNNLPEKAYDAMQYAFDRNEISNATIYSIINDNDKYSTLPRNFNSYLVVSTDRNMLITASTETNTYVSNKLKPISNKNNLIALYETYKSLNASVNLNKIKSLLNNMSDGVDKITEDLKRKLPTQLEIIDSFKDGVIKRESLDSATILSSEAIAIIKAKFDMNDIYKELEDTQKFLIKYFNTLQVMLKELTVNLAGTHTELRYELAKYLYQSARLYK